jgi:hypothetical protein
MFFKERSDCYFECRRSTTGHKEEKVSARGNVRKDTFTGEMSDFELDTAKRFEYLLYRRGDHHF